MVGAGQQNKGQPSTGRNIGGPLTRVWKFQPQGLSVEEVKQRGQEFASSWGPLESTALTSADYYFASYAHFGIHEEMLKDNVRTGAYQRAIMNNGHLFKGKTVLDVGSGTGVLSMFAALAGAEHVYAIECSDIVSISRELIERNGMADKITLIQAKAEEAELPVSSVDIIISEWMGYFLLYESMLDTVIYCRDKWLKKGGMLFPDRATLHVAAIEDDEYRREKFDYWNSPYGLDFTPVKKYIMEEPLVDVVQPEAVVSDPCCVLDLDLNTCTVEETNFVAPFSLRMRRKDHVHALIAWFDCQFSACHTTISFSTGPFTQTTHCKQVVFYVQEPLAVDRNEELKGWIAVRKNAKNPRDLDIKIVSEFSGQWCTQTTQQFYRLR